MKYAYDFDTSDGLWHRFPAHLDPMTRMEPYESGLMGPLVAGKGVCIVGNAESVSGSAQGPQIDSCDVVLRMSHAVNGTFSVDDVGSKTSVWCLNHSSVRRILRGHYRLPDGRIWYFRDFGRWTPEGWFDHPGMVVHASLGTILIAECLRAGAKRVFVCGMDFFRTCDPAAPTRGEATVVRPRDSGSTGHSYDMDEAYVRHLYGLHRGVLTGDGIFTEIMEGNMQR